ncbi:hypothetical protein D3C75_922230 [compost metagenome]
MVLGAPFMCISTTEQPNTAAVARLSGSCISAVTSFHIVAPAPTAARATPGFMVSMLIIPSQRARSAVIRGATRSISSSSRTGSDPGRVLSPPMSRTSAPCSIKRRA